jgi:hypothetical protein
LNRHLADARMGRSTRGPGSSFTSSDRAEIGRTLPLLLFITGVFLVLIPTNTVFVAAAFLAGLISIRALYLLVFRPGNFRFTWLLGTGLLLGYGLGTFNSAGQLLASGATVAASIGRDDAALCVALAVCVWVSATLYFVGSLLEAPVKLDLSGLQSYDLIFLWAAMAIVAAAYLTGGIGYMGAEASDVTHHESPLGAFASLMSPVLPSLTVLLRNKSKLLKRSVAFWMVLGMEFAALFPQGRRVLIYSAVVLFVALTISGTRFKLASGKTILTLLLAVGTLYLGNKIFYAMRYERAHSGRRSSIDLISNVQGAIEIVLSGDSRYNAAVGKNLRERTLVLKYFSDILDASWHREPLWGRATIFDLRVAIPSVLDPNKADILAPYGMEETLVNPAFGLKPIDEANTILTTGLADFSLVGCFVYPFLVCALFSALYRFSTRWLPPPIVVVVFFAMTFLMLQADVTTANYVISCRNLAAISAGFVLLGKLRNTLWRPRPVLSGTGARPVFIVASAGTPLVPNTANAQTLKTTNR